MVEMKAKKYVEVVDELKEVIGKSVGDIDVLNTMDSNSFEALKISLKLIDISNELIVEMSKGIDEINTKLDKLLKQNEK